MQMNGAAKIRRFGNRISLAKDRGNVLIDAADRFQARRQDAEHERAAAKLIPVWAQAPIVGETPPKPADREPAGKPQNQVVRALKPRIKLDETRVFILSRDEIVLDENGVRCVPFTVLPAPRDPDDDRRYLMPYILRGWDHILFPDPDDPDLPCALQKHADPYRTFETALSDLPVDKRDAYRRPSGYKLYYPVPDPLG